jgi:hypothetical protein
LRFALRLQKFDGDVVEGNAGVGAGDVGEASAGVADLAVGHDETGFGLAGYRVDDVGGAEADVNVRQLVLMEKCGVMRGDANAKHSNIRILKHQMMVRLVGDRDGDRCLGTEGKCEHEHKRTKKRFHVTSAGSGCAAIRKMAM